MSQKGVALLGAGTVDELEDGGAAEDIEVISVGVVFVKELVAIGLMGELVVEEEQFLLIDMDQALVFTDGLHIRLVFHHQDQEDGDDEDGGCADGKRAGGPDQPYGYRTGQHREQPGPAEDGSSAGKGFKAGFECRDPLLIEYGRGLGAGHGVKLMKQG